MVERVACCGCEVWIMNGERKQTTLEEKKKNRW
jgi:hypothetical protein